MTTAIIDRREAAKRAAMPTANGTPVGPPHRKLTAQEYLAIEREAEFKSEFVDGEMIAMAGASLKHIDINSNFAFHLRLSLEGREFSVYSNDFRVRIRATNLYTYPDTLAVRGSPILDDALDDVLMNPCLIAEVLSPSTEKYDRGKKFEQYRSLESLQEYLLLSQNRVRAELFTRQTDGTWMATVFDDPTGDLVLSSLAVRIPLAKIYAKVNFEPEPAETPNPGAEQ